MSEINNKNVDYFNRQIHSLSRCSLPVSRQKMASITKAALLAIENYKFIVKIVEHYIRKCPSEYKIPGLYSLDAIVRQSLYQFKHKDVFVPRFTIDLPTTIANITSAFNHNNAIQRDLLHVLQLWLDDDIFNNNLIHSLFQYAQNPSTNFNCLKKAKEIASGLTIELRMMKKKSSISSGNNIQMESNQKPVTLVKPKIEKKSSDEENSMKSFTKSSTTTTTKLPPPSSFAFYYSRPNHQIGGHTPQSLIAAIKNFISSIKCESTAHKMDLETSEIFFKNEIERFIKEKLINSLESLELSQLLFDMSNCLIEYTLDATNSQKPILPQLFFDYDIENETGTPPTTTAANCEEKLIKIEKFVTTVRELARSLTPLPKLPDETVFESDTNDKHVGVVGYAEVNKSLQKKTSISPFSAFSSPKAKIRRIETSKLVKESKKKEVKKMPLMKENYVCVMSRTLYVGHLPKSTDVSEIQKIAEEYGELIDAVKRSGCCFVTFNHRKNACRALKELQGKTFHNRPMRVQWAYPNKILEEFWDSCEGCGYIPVEQFAKLSLDKIIEGHAEIWAESVPPNYSCQSHEEDEFNQSTEMIPVSSANSVIVEDDDEETEENLPYVAGYDYAKPIAIGSNKYPSSSQTMTQPIVTKSPPQQNFTFSLPHPSLVIPAVNGNGGETSSTATTTS